MRRSSQITLLFSGALATVVGQNGCSDSKQPPPPLPAPGAPIVSEADATSDQNKALQNNAYTPGLGYYHSFYHGWYPYPFNFYYPSFGYFWGGRWNAQPMRGTVPSFSAPSAMAFERARNAFRYGTSYYSSGGSNWGSSFGGGHGYYGGSSRGGSGESGISHGGFGESGHSSGGHGGGE